MLTRALAALRRYGVSSEALAERAGVSVARVEALGHGARPTRTELRRIFHAGLRLQPTITWVYWPDELLVVCL